MANSAPPDTNQNKLKTWIVILLAVSCITALVLYFSYSPPEHKRFQSSAELDSLITLNFDRFNISDNQIRVRTVEIDTATIRKVYSVRVPPGFSKTQWHYELDKMLRPYRSSTPARVIFPERHLRIHITYGPNIVRTIQMQTDPSLVLYRDFASLILAFDRPPPESVLNRIKAFGEPIQLAIRSQSPRTEFEAIRELRRKYPHTVWLLKDNNGRNFDQLSDMDVFLNRLDLIDQIDTGARVLFYNPYEEISDNFSRQMSRKNLLLVDVSEAIHVDDLSDQRQVALAKQEMLQRSSLTLPPAVIVEGSNANIRQLQAFISALKQDHVQLRSPYFMEF